MAYTQIPLQTLSNAGDTIVWTLNDLITDPLPTGMKFQNDGNTYLIAINNNEAAATATVTLASSGTVNGLALANVSKEIAAGAFHIFGRLPIEAWNVQSGPDINSVLITVTGDAAPDVAFALIK